jgi:hypothetical protein
MQNSQSISRIRTHATIGRCVKQLLQSLDEPHLSDVAPRLLCAAKSEQCRWQETLMAKCGLWVRHRTKRDAPNTKNKYNNKICL